jgi:glycosyltransferase involved in cell wall biosynthesis
MAHEQHYPAGLYPLDWLLIGVPQLVQFQVMAGVCDAVLFSTEVAQLKYRRRYPRRRDRFHWLPVASNIPVVVPEAATAAISPSELILVQFGTPHPTRLFTHAIAALDRARRAGLEARLIAVGVQDERLAQELVRAGRSDLRPYAQGLGYLSIPETSEHLQRADLVLAPFMDGVSSRRTSVMAALAHGRPVLTTRAWATDPSADWESFTRVVDAESPERFAQAALELLGDPAERDRLGKLGHDAYQAMFDWPVIGARLVALLGAEA